MTSETKEVIARQTLDLSSKEAIATLKATVAQGLTDAEFALFLEHCKGTGLNPFKKEVWAIKAGGRLQLMTGLNGYLAIANAHPQFDGLECEVDNDDNPTKATAKVWRKDRRFPATGVALMREYRKDTPIWRQMPRVMLTKVAKSIALREAFIQELGGTYTDDEMPVEFSAPREQARVEPQVSQTEPLVSKSGTVEGEVIREAKQPQGRFVYDITLISPDRYDDAAKILRLNKAEPQNDTATLWVSPVQINKLKNYVAQEAA